MASADAIAAPPKVDASLQTLLDEAATLRESMLAASVGLRAWRPRKRRETRNPEVHHGDHGECTEEARRILIGEELTRRGD
jgi:hypothetical protein